MDLVTLLSAAILVGIAYVSGRSRWACSVARRSGGPDPRTIGSGRTGGTNALRALGRKWAAVVVIGDLAKGALPVLLARFVTGQPAIEVACGLAAVGRCVALRVPPLRRWPRGRDRRRHDAGHPAARGPPRRPVFVLVILVTRYVSLGSLLGSAAMFPAMGLLWLVASGAVPPAYLVYAVAGPALIWLAHADNIDRLIHGTERKFDLTSLLGGRRTGGT